MARAEVAGWLELESWRIILMHDGGGVKSVTASRDLDTSR